MTHAHRDVYLARFRRVLETVDRDLDGDLGLDRLCRVAAFSKFHFHRQFSELFGLPLHRYVQLRRMKRASYELAFRGDASVLDVALGAGYEGPEAFARAFKKWAGQSPSEFRKDPEWISWDESYRLVRDIRSEHMKPSHRVEDVKIVDFAETKVATLVHRGDPRLIGDTIRRFIEWRKTNALPPRVSATFNVAYGDPTTTAADEFRMDLCAATTRDVAPNPQGVVAGTIPAGRCAVLRHVGSDDSLGATARYLYVDWLPDSGEELRDFPLFFQRVAFFPDVPEHEAITDVFLPLKAL